MSDAVQKIKICPACAAELREGAGFCFNCGKSFDEIVSPAPSAVEDHGSQSHARVRKARSRPAAGDAGEPRSEKTGEAPGEDVPSVKVKRSAEGFKRQPRQPRRAVSIVWTEPSEGPGAAFVLGAAAVGLVSGLLFLLALYLK